MANSQYISAQELQDVYAPYLDYSSFSAASISGMISVASRWVDSVTNANNGWDRETITNESYSSNTAHTDSDGNLFIPLIKRPLTSVNDVSSISINLGTYSTSLTLTSGGTSVLASPAPGWQVVYPNTWLVSTGTLLSNQKLYNLRSYGYNIAISYTAGYAQIPLDIKMATVLAVENQMAKRFNQSGAISVSQGSMSMSFSKGKIGDEPPLLAEAKMYLRNYIRVV